MQSKNNGTLFEKNDSTERLNVANGNGGGHGVPNGNSHKGQLTASWLESSIYISSVKGIDISYTQQKTHNLFWPDENSIEQCFAAHIVHGC